MKLHSPTTQIERSGVHAESSFTIRTTAKSFEILSSGLYTDAITAVIRELSCNAYDAHVAAGKKDIPFHVHLPNSLEPYFSVKDFGIGLSDEQVRGKVVPVMSEDRNGNIIQDVDDQGNLKFLTTGGLYTTYFDSTKTESNDFIGALGLGSKSPFSYVDAFDVISHYNGIRYIYSVFLNEERIPSVALMGQHETTEENGLEVRLTVDSKDSHSFQTKTASVLRFFDPRPIVKGIQHFEFNEMPKTVLGHDNWLITSRKWNQDSFIAVQGNVPYRVNVSQLQDKLSAKDINLLTKLSIVGFFDIGDLDVAANREEIRYDEQTQKNLIKIVNDVRTSLTKEIEKKIDAHSDSYWEACVQLTNIASELFGSLNFFFAVVDKTSITNPMMSMFIEQQGLVCLDKFRKHSIVQYDSRSTLNPRRKPVSSSFTPTNNIEVIYCDVKSVKVGRIKEYLKNSSSCGNVLVIFPIDNPQCATEDCNLSQDEEFKLLIDQLGNPPIKNLSKISSAPNSIKRKVPFYQCGKLKERKDRYWKTQYTLLWDNVDEPSKPKGLYFDLVYRRHIADSSGHILNWNQQDILSNFKTMIRVINEQHGTSFTINDLYGVSKTSANIIKKKSGWVNIFDMFKEIIPKYQSVYDDYQSYNATPNELSIKNAIETNNEFIQHVVSLDTDSVFRQNVLTAHKKYKTFHDCKQIVNLINLYFTTSLHKHKTKYVPIFDKTGFAKYPLLTYINFTNVKKWDDLFDYIKLIDRS